MSSVVECFRGSSVRVFRLDRQACLERLMARARAALDRCPELLEVRLFGSLARGDAAPGSDADLLVELAESRLTFLERIASLQPLFGAVGLGVDLLPYTTAELDALRREANPLLRAAQAEGIVLARRGAPPPTR